MTHWALRLEQLFLHLGFTLPAVVVLKRFLPSVLLVVALVLIAFSPTFTLIKPLVLELGGVVSE